MSISLLVANVITFLAFIVHTFMGDKDVKKLEPNGNASDLREYWTLTRCGWHMISFDLLFMALLMAVINFSDIIGFETQLLQILAVYFAGYAVSFFLTISISKSFTKNYLKLGQWILLLTLSGLTYMASI